MATTCCSFSAASHPPAVQGLTRRQRRRARCATPSRSMIPAWSTRPPRPRPAVCTTPLGPEPGREGLEPGAREAGKVRAARAQHDSGLVDQAATAAAVRLLKAHRTGCCQDEAPAYWRIGQEKRQDAEAAVADAVGRGEIDALFAEARPIHPDYLALARAYASETDSDRRAAIAANLDRWRWMPRALGARYLVVHAAAFEVTLWQNNHRLGRWQVIVGKPKTPTHVFAAQVTGGNLNHLWEIPG